MTSPIQPRRTWLSSLILAALAFIVVGVPAGTGLFLFFQSRAMGWWLLGFPAVIGGFALAVLRRRPADNQSERKPRRGWVIALVGVVGVFAFDAAVLFGGIGTDPNSCGGQRWEQAADVRAIAEVREGLGLAGDGKGSFEDAVDGVDAYSHHLLTLAVSKRPSTRMAKRQLQLDLTRPVSASGSVSLGARQAASIKSYWYKDSARVVHAVQGIPKGATVASDRTDFLLEIEGKPHRLTMGRWAATYCDAEPGTGGIGTTPVMITRSDTQEFLVEAPANSVARLWDISASDGPFGPRAPTDKGLYQVSFSVRFRAK